MRSQVEVLVVLGCQAHLLRRFLPSRRGSCHAGGEGDCRCENIVVPVHMGSLGGTCNRGVLKK